MTSPDFHSLVQAALRKEFPELGRAPTVYKSCTQSVIRTVEVFAKDGILPTDHAEPLVTHFTKRAKEVDRVLLGEIQPPDLHTPFSFVEMGMRACHSVESNVRITHPHSGLPITHANNREERRLLDAAIALNIPDPSHSSPLKLLQHALRFLRQGSESVIAACSVSLAYCGTVVIIDAPPNATKIREKPLTKKEFATLYHRNRRNIETTLGISVFGTFVRIAGSLLLPIASQTAEASDERH